MEAIPTIIVGQNRYTHILKLVISLVMFLFMICVYAQNKEKSLDDSFNQQPRLTTSGVAYMDPSNPEQHSNFTINYQVNSNLFIELQGHYDSYAFGDIFRTPIMGKKYVSNKLYLLLGLEAEFTSFSENWSKSTPQFRSINGVGYDINHHFSMEIQKKFDFNNKLLTPISNPNSLSIKGKFKF